MNGHLSSESVRFGNQLKDARAAHGLSREDVARETKIPERSLERLEEGRFAELPNTVFVKGFLRAYSRCVGLAGDDMVRQYGRIIGDELARSGLRAGSERQKNAHAWNEVISRMRVFAAANPRTALAVLFAVAALGAFLILS